MKIYHCIDLSERLQALTEREPDAKELLERLKEQAGYDSCDRIYVGTSFCAQYFLHIRLQVIHELAKLCSSRQIKMTLVVPTFTQKHLANGKKKLEEYQELFGKVIDEIAVNDYGMIKFIHETYGEQTALVMGRLLYKDYREPRYPEYFNEVHEPKIFTPELERIIERYNITGMLFDASHRKMDFSHKPESIEVGIYEPYTYITMGQICEIGSSHLPMEKKFRPNAVCQEQCSHQQLHYFMEDGTKWLRVGRAVYFENRNVKVSGLTSYRRIYCPLEGEIAK